jgi:hypothetical protein
MMLLLLESKMFLSIPSFYGDHSIDEILIHGILVIRNCVNYLQTVREL